MKLKKNLKHFLILKI